ncbi:ribosomal protein L7/L12 [Streptomyces syringium]|uniref:ribosomal protein L7/L12 n=1 Tax=Streptomyces syringium TaxID=76729 RepID=UPI003410CFAC
MDMAILLVFPLLGLLGWSIENRIDRLNRKIARLERKIDLIVEHLGVPDEEPELTRITELACSGEKIKAIKAYRELTGEGLKESKDAVERLVTRT